MSNASRLRQKLCDIISDAGILLGERAMVVAAESGAPISLPDGKGPVQDSPCLEIGAPVLAGSQTKGIWQEEQYSVPFRLFNQDVDPTTGPTALMELHQSVRHAVNSTACLGLRSLHVFDGGWRFDPVSDKDIIAGHGMLTLPFGLSVTMNVGI